MATNQAPVKAEPQLTIFDLLQQSRKQLELAIPRGGMTGERMVRLAMNEMRRVPKLMECDAKSLMGAIMEAAQLGLEIGGPLGQSFLIPYKKEAKLIVGYKGFLALLGRIERVSHCDAHIVRANDQFDYQYGSAPYLHHKEAKADRGEIIAVYAVVHFVTGKSDFEVASWDDILAFRKAYIDPKNREEWQRKNSPWYDESGQGLIEMAEKTMIRRIAKRCPFSTDLQRVASEDEYREKGIEFAQTSLPEKSKTEALADEFAGDRVILPTEETDENGTPIFPPKEKVPVSK